MMSSIKPIEILCQRIDSLEKRLTHNNGSQEPIQRRLIVKASDELQLVCGQASVILKKDGTVSIRAKDIEIAASGTVAIKASRDLVLKGAKILQN
jgi:type VI secretion system secreted protein VgrG